ncbi:MAG: hypothetical protein JOZ09_11705 [Pseudonocardiales bacterium]|nr:hypothetical protein [Pseudonocardiales bacterium]
MPAAEFGQLGNESVDTSSTFVIIVDCLDDLGEFGIFVRLIRRGSGQPCIETTAGHAQYLTHQGNRDPFFAWLTSFFFIQIADEGELHVLSFVNHAAAFFKFPVPSSNGGPLPQVP